jgi:hypothetical protein
MPQLNHAAISPQRALAPCHPAPQLACVQERCRTHADGMEIFLSGMPARPQCSCPESASRTVRYCQALETAARPGGLGRRRGLAVGAIDETSQVKQETGSPWSTWRMRAKAPGTR